MGFEGTLIIPEFEQPGDFRAQAAPQSWTLRRLFAQDLGYVVWRTLPELARAIVARAAFTEGGQKVRSGGDK